MRLSLASLCCPSAAYFLHCSSASFALRRTLGARVEPSPAPHNSQDSTSKFAASPQKHKYTTLFPHPTTNPYHLCSQIMAIDTIPANDPTGAGVQIPSAFYPLVRPHARQLMDKLHKFVTEECQPAAAVYHHQIQKGANRWKVVPAVMEELKARAKSLGLWNLWMHSHYKEGAGLTNVEYGLMAEIMGHCHVASEACNCSAPDTGNMEVIAKYGTDEQKATWLRPLMDGKIRSAFAMTEPGIASSDATNIGLSMKQEGNEWVLNGRKWWISGAGDPRCKIYIVMGKSSPNASSEYKKQSVILVPADTPGVTVIRPLGVFGYDDAPEGHCELLFENCRVPLKNMVLGEGRGFEIIQGRLGPGRIHHCMRSIGVAERALQLMIKRVVDPAKRQKGKLLVEEGVILARMADSRIHIDAARLMVLNAAAQIDLKDAKSALNQIAEAKVMVPAMALQVVDHAMQAYGAEGICQDSELPLMWAHLRTLRYADGPDESHQNQLGRIEAKKAKWIVPKFAAEDAARAQAFKKAGLSHLINAKAQI
ncbi:acyl-CoA dehydrogenase/oxidase [Protomyces lactucae-debilis]|uniref:Acyl-CoA dehydrogenase/oxidase n=1 Tax=Protomyces lactucae-debilis TaxID=2754530 RepID=A0A1Y2FSL1_PROLT|nr:acyl-CoA dehydrogenase/oxidase [Protomyces lactucae-debilis]ORY87000.1 acyl-CoA dehydrogenase/oxidase [Protomyces lactucae-debilis]